MNVCILMATYNGEKYIEEQIASIISQQGCKISLLISDDGSKDSTLKIIDKYQKKYFNNFKILSVFQNINNTDTSVYKFSHSLLASKASNNFCNLIKKANNTYDYYAFSDQDDIWHKDKIKRAISVIKKSTTPFLYCSSSNLVDSKGKFLQKSPERKVNPCFENALVQSIAAGNTMIMNKPAFLLLKRSIKELQIPAHDWWTYILITAAGGSVFYDDHASLDYRIHDENITGTNYNFIQFLKRLFIAIKGNYKIWNQLNCAALIENLDILDSKSKSVLDNFMKSRISSLLFRNYYLLKSGVFREQYYQRVLMHIGMFFNKI